MSGWGRPFLVIHFDEFKNPQGRVCVACVDTLFLAFLGF
jgi:hypothetical protein